MERTTPCMFAVVAGVAFGMLMGTTPTLAAPSTEIAAIYASTANGYHRQRNSNGTFKPETYTFAEGGKIDSPLVDDSLDKLTFTEVARTISDALRSQNYTPAASADEATLMIMVFWGATFGSDGGQYTNQHANVTDAAREIRSLEGPAAQKNGFVERLAQGQQGPVKGAAFDDTPSAAIRAARERLYSSLQMNQMSNAERDRNNRHNAAILGFTEEYEKRAGLPIAHLSQDLIDDLEANRYVVVLKAYDFQRLRNKKQKYILWETRFSVRQRSDRFDRALPAMSMAASKYFGQRSGRLLRETIPLGQVQIGPSVPVSDKA